MISRVAFSDKSLVVALRGRVSCAARQGGGGRIEGAQRIPRHEGTCGPTKGNARRSVGGSATGGRVRLARVGEQRPRQALGPDGGLGTVAAGTGRPAPRPGGPRCPSTEGSPA